MDKCGDLPARVHHVPLPQCLTGLHARTLGNSIPELIRAVLCNNRYPWCEKDWRYRRDTWICALYSPLTSSIADLPLDRHGCSVRNPR